MQPPPAEEANEVKYVPQSPGKPVGGRMNRTREQLLPILCHWITFLAHALPLRSVPTFIELVVGALLSQRGWVTAAYLAIAAGILGICYLASYAVSALSILRIVNALLVTVWFGFVGYGLCKKSLS